MKTKTWINEANSLSALLQSLVFTDNSGGITPIDLAFELWSDWTIELKKNTGTIYLIGNGASASMASHYAADLAKNGGLHTEVFSDLSLITAISNDMGYEHVFSEPKAENVAYFATRESQMRFSSQAILSAGDLASNVFTKPVMWQKLK